MEGEQSVIGFLGPTFTELEEKFRQWLRLTYSTSLLPLPPTTLTFSANDELHPTTIVSPQLSLASPLVVPQTAPAFLSPLSSIVAPVLPLQTITPIPPSPASTPAQPWPT